MFPVAGFMMDRFGRRYATIPGICIFATGMALMPFTGTFTWLLLAAILMRLGNGIASGTMMTLGADLAPQEGTGEFLGLWRLTGDFGGSVGPVVVGQCCGSIRIRLFGLRVGWYRLFRRGDFFMVSSRDVEKRVKRVGALGRCVYIIFCRCRERGSNPYARNAH